MDEQSFADLAAAVRSDIETRGYALHCEVKKLLEEAERARRAERDLGGARLGWSQARLEGCK